MAEPDEIKEGGEKGKEEFVTLPKEEYEKIVTSMTETENLLKTLSLKEEEKERAERQKEAANAEKERIEREGKEGAPEFEKMSAREFADFVIRQAQREIGEPLLKMITTLAVREEKRSLEKHIRDEGGNPKEFEKEVFDAANSNPSLSLMDAYKIVKDNRASAATKAAREAEEKKKLEASKEGGPGAGGEKPGASKDTLSPGGKLTLEDAATKAFKEVYKGETGG